MPYLKIAVVGALGVEEGMSRVSVPILPSGSYTPGIYTPAARGVGGR